MPPVISSLSKHQEKQLMSLFGHVRLHLLYKAIIHGFTAAAFHGHCDRQGPTVIVAYNAAGFVFGAYTSKDYTQSGAAVIDGEAFLYSINDGRNEPLRVGGISGQHAFTDEGSGPNYGALVFLHEDKSAVQSNPGSCFNFKPEEMHGTDLKLTEFEVYRVEGLDVLEKPWRNIQWTAEYVRFQDHFLHTDPILWFSNVLRKKQQLMKSIQNYQPEIQTVNQARVLLVGPVGAGKSSFFNSINSAFRGNMTCQAITGTAGTSVTTQYRAYTIKAGRRGGNLPLVLCDTMGLEENPESGLNIDDVVSIFKGHMMDRYQFSTSSSILEDSPGYKKHVNLSDMIHCVAYVIDSCKVALLSQKMVDKFSAIRKKANHLGIPQVVLMTKVDEACPLVAKDISNVYHSVYIQKKARQLSESLGIPLSYVMPVKNYSEELELDQNTDILLFMALEQMLNYADSYFENQIVEDRPENSRPELYRSSDHPRQFLTEHDDPKVV